jgi:P-type E1-E2 ATPase
MNNVYFVSGMWCSSCAKNVRDAVSRINGVHSAEINFASKLLVVDYLDTISEDSKMALDLEIQKRVTQIGFGIKRQPDGWVLNFDKELGQELDSKLSWPLIGLLWFLAMWSSMLGYARYAGGDLSPRGAFYLALASAAFGLPAILLGLRFYLGPGLRALIYNRRLTLDLFVALGGCAATMVTLISFFENRADSYADSGSMIIAILLMTKKIENEVVKKISGSILFELRPGKNEVLVWRKNQWQTALSSQIKKEDRVRVAKDETILFDGILCSDLGSVSAHLLSGEMTESTLKTGDSVYAGMIAKTDMEILVQSPMGCRRIDNWASQVFASGAKRSRYEKYFARFESWLVIAALAGAVAAAFFEAGRGKGIAPAFEAFFIGILVFCPCLFASIFPLCKQMAHFSLLKKGIFLFRSDALFDLCDVRHFYFDKTGTLEAVQSHYESLSETPFEIAYLEELAAKCWHPILRGLESRADTHLLSSIQETPGQGARAVTADGSVLLVGSASYLQQEGVLLKDTYDPDFPGVAFRGVQQGQLVLKKIYDMKARSVLKKLMALRPQSRIIILSGDPALDAGRIFLKSNKQVLYRGGMSPEDKARAIKARSAFIGDGLNDTLALAKANVSFCIGDRISGFAPVDFQLQIPNLDLILFALRYSSKYRRVLLQTVGAAFLYNILALSLAMLGFFSPLGAAISMLFSFFVLLLSILRLLNVEVMT